MLRLLPTDPVGRYVLRLSGRRIFLLRLVPDETEAEDLAQVVHWPWSWS